MPFCSHENYDFGGNTSCIRVDDHGRTLLVDCGTGVLQYLQEIKKDIEAEKPIRLDILLSHLHLDHIIGLAAFTPLWNPRNSIHIYTKSRNNLPLKEQIFGMFAPPYWPIDLKEMVNATCVEISDAEFVTSCGFTIKPFPTYHNDATTAFKITGEKTFVTLIDCEINQNWLQKNDFVSNCMDADAILFDSSYLPKDYIGKEGWGHSTYEHGMQLAEIAHSKKMIFSHFSHDYSDNLLRKVENSLNSKSKQYLIAYDGMELSI